MKTFFTSFSLTLILLTGVYTKTKAQTTLTTGDIAFVMLNLDANPMTWSWVPLVDIQPSTVIYFTDNGWHGGNGAFIYDLATLATNNDDLLTFSVSSLIPKGTVITFTGTTFSPSYGSLSWTGVAPPNSSSGDQMFAFQGSFGTPTFIAGIHSDYNSSLYDETTKWHINAVPQALANSSLPPDLINGTSAVSLFPGITEKDNAKYTGSTTIGTKTELLEAINNYENWSSDDAIAYTWSSGNFTVNSSLLTPTVTTQAVSGISKTSATGNGNVTATGGANITERGFYWSTNNGFANGAGTKVSTTGNWTTTGAFTQEITGLSAGTTYYVKAFATNSAGTGYGSQVSFTTKATPVITWSNPADITYGTLLSATQLNATANTAGTFSYTPALGTKLNAGNGQTLQVNFTPTDLTNFEATSKTVSINVAKATPVITWSNPAGITYGTLLSATQLNATADVAGSMVYTPAIGTKLNAGVDQDLKADFTPTDANNYNTATKTVKINVAKANPVITWSNPAGITYGTLLSATQLNATADVAGSMVYTPAIGTKLNAGNAQDLKADFTPTDANNYNTATKTVKIDVAKATPVITWSNPAGITYGTLLSATQLNATADVAGSMVYTPALGTKLNAGNTQDLKADFTPTDAVNYNTATKTVKIDVAKATPVITWSNPAGITYGTLLSATQLNATADVAGSMVYTPAIGTKLNAGVDQDLKADFTPTDANNYNTATKTVKIDVAKATPVITWSNPAGITYGTLLSATQLNATADVAGSIVYTPAIGTKLNAGADQDLKADFTPTDANNYNTATKTVKINVAKANPAITWSNPAGITYGTLLSATQLNATADVAGSMVYTPSIGTKLNAGADQDLKADFTPTDANNYNTATKTVKINVAKANPVITWSNPAGITYGTLLSATQLNATADVAGSMVYTPAIGAKLNAGVDQDLKADFTPTDANNYNTATKTVKINVAKANPVITWSNPENITYGVALSATQLNATANVAGVFIYTPDFGTVLSVGDGQVLKADFNPTDAANYESTSKTVLINVILGTNIPKTDKDILVIYPNPTTDNFAIAGMLNDIRITISDLKGLSILNKKISIGEHVDVQTLSKGIYIVQIVSNGKVFTTKLIKN